MTNIGQIIKKLRKERDLTQEELAEQLNITAQAASKWENGTGLPDISQVVPLSNVFGVPTDVLFGTQNVNRDEEVERIIEEASAPQRLHYETEEEHFQVDVKEYETYIDALKTYPNSIPLLHTALSRGSNLAHNYQKRGDQERASEIWKECIRQANVILNSSNDISMILDTHHWLVWTYCDMGDFVKAEEHAEKMPHGFGNESGMMKSWIRRAARDTDGEIEVRCGNIAGIIDLLESEIRPLGDAYFRKGQYEDAIRVYRSLYDLLPVIYGSEEYTPPLHTLPWVAYGIASSYVMLEKYDEAVEWLWKDFEHLCSSAKHYNKTETLETPLLRTCKFRFFGEAMNPKDHMDYLEVPRFAPLHDHPRFVELVEKLASMG